MIINDSFKGNDLITLQPGDALVPYAFLFTVCSASTANDGALPFGETISSITTTIHSETGMDQTTALMSTSSLASFTNTLKLTYPTSTDFTPGRFHVKMLVYLTATSQCIEFDFHRLLAKDI